MNFEVKDIPEKIGPLLQKLSHYTVSLFAVVVIGLFGYIIYTINTLGAQAPDEDVVLERLERVQRPRIDEDVLQKITELEDLNIQTQALFEEARNNPFSE